MSRFLFVIICLAPLGCSSSADPQSKTSPITATPLTEYTVRGRVEALAGKTIHIRHEAVPGFKDATGGIIGMKTMKMAFTLGKGVSNASKPGDAVEFVFTMSYVSKPQLVVKSIKALEQTTLKFEVPK